MTADLGRRLQGLGLSQYFDVLVDNGFDNWVTVLDIHESDLDTLHFKLGHRRKLQRAIAEYRGQAHYLPLIPTGSKSISGDGVYRSDDSAAESKGRQADAVASNPPGTSTKRKYRRHPKPDQNAPERPPSAYVIFSNQVREALKGQDLSFTEIAKVVGERWQVLATDAREACERQAHTAKEKYYAALAEYKKTPQYAAYQKYLDEFKAKHTISQKGSEGKRSKMEVETGLPNRRSSHEQNDQGPNRRLSTHYETNPMASYRAESSPPLSSTRVASNPYLGKSTSPATHSLSELNSPRIPEHYSPLSASPHSGTQVRENTFDNHSRTFPHEAIEAHTDPSLSLPSSSYWHQASGSSTTPASLPYGSHFQGTIDLPSRRSYREPTRLPSFVRDDTNTSQDSSGKDPVFAPAAVLPVLTAPQAHRVLPQPAPSIGAATYIDRPPLAVSSGQHSQELRPISSLATLLRAGELVNAADEDLIGKERPS